MSEAPLTHPTAEELRALSLGRLGEAELARVSAHLGDCPECCRRIDELAAADPLLARLQQTAARRDEVLVSPAQRRSAVRALRQTPAGCDGRTRPGSRCLLIPRPPGRSGITTSWPRSVAAAWGWCTRRGIGASTGWRP